MRKVSCSHPEFAMFTVKVDIMRGWRGSFCTDCLTKWIKEHPMMLRHGKVTITNTP